MAYYKSEYMVFVTGGTGLVGARLIYDLDKKGEQIIALKRQETPVAKFVQMVAYYTNTPNELANRVTWVHGDILDYESLLMQIPPGAKVYHCAAYVSFNKADQAKILESNIEGTANLINACLQKGIQKFCHVSSIAAIGGTVNGKIIDETTPWSASGKSNYSLSKYYAEMEVWRGIAEGLHAVIVNPAVILGPGIWSQGSPSFFPLIANGLKFYTKGSTSYVDVRDVTRAMIFLMEGQQEAEKFLLGSETLSYQNFFTQIANSLQVKAPTIYANRYVTGIVWRVLALFSFFSGRMPKITRQTHRISHILDAYSGKKFSENSGFVYTPIQDTIAFIAKHFNARNI
jgi:nucleoside-diphosphate-sugar epimerase